MAAGTGRVGNLSGFPWQRSLAGGGGGSILSMSRLPLLSAYKLRREGMRRVGGGLHQPPGHT